MKEEDKKIIRHLINKELKLLGQEKINIEFPPLNFIKSQDVYERELKRIIQEFN